MFKISKRPVGAGYLGMNSCATIILLLIMSGCGKNSHCDIAPVIEDLKSPTDSTYGTSVPVDFKVYGPCSLSKCLYGPGTMSGSNCNLSYYKSQYPENGAVKIHIIDGFFFPKTPGRYCIKVSCESSAGALNADLPFTIK